MFTRLGALLVFALMCGCSSVETVQRDSEDPSFQKMNRDLRGQIVRVELNSGEAMTVTSLRVDADSISWIDRRTNTLESEPTTNVRELSIRKAGRGAIMGLVTGVVVGAAAGGVRAAVEGDDPATDPLAISREQKLRVFPPAHAVYASLISTPIGAIMGAKKRFRFDQQTEPPATISRR